MEGKEGVKRDTFWKNIDDSNLVEGHESKPINEASGYVSNTRKFDSFKETVENKRYPTEGDIEDFLENLKELNSCGTSGFEEVAVSSKFCSQSNVNNEHTHGVGKINVCFLNDRNGVCSNGSKLDNVSNKALVSYKPDGTLVKTIIRNEPFIDKTITNQDVSNSSDRLVYVNVNKNEDSTGDFSDVKYDNDIPKKCHKSEERKFGRRLEERRKEGRYRERSSRGRSQSKEDQRKDRMNRRGGDFKECRGGEEPRRNSRDGRYRSDSRESDRRYRRSPSRERYPYKDRSPQPSKKLSLSPSPLRESNKSPLKLDREVDPMTRRYGNDFSKIGFPSTLPTNPFLRPKQPQFMGSGLNIGFPPMNVPYPSQAISVNASGLLRPATFTAPLTGGVPSFSGPGAGGSGGGGVSSYTSTKPGIASVGMETKQPVVQQEPMWRQQAPGVAGQWSDRGGGGYGGPSRVDQQQKPTAGVQWSDRGGGGSFGGSTRGDQLSVGRGQWTDVGGAGPMRSDPKPIAGSQWTDRGGGGPTRSDPKPTAGSQWTDRGGGGPTRSDPKPTAGSQWTDRSGGGSTRSGPKAGSQWSERGGGGPTRGDQKPTAGGDQWSERGGGGPSRVDQKASLGGPWCDRGGGGATRSDQKPTVGGQWSERGGGGPTRGEQKATVGGQWSVRSGSGPTRGDQKATPDQLSERVSGGPTRGDQKSTTGGQWSDPDRGDQKQSSVGQWSNRLGGGSARADTQPVGSQWSDRGRPGGLGGSNRVDQGRSSPYTQYADYRSTAPPPPTLKRNLESFSSQPMTDRNEMLKKPKLVIDPNRIPTPPPPPILGKYGPRGPSPKYVPSGSSPQPWEHRSTSSAHQEGPVGGVSLSCLLETVMEHTGQGKSQVSDPKVKTSILSKCEAKINQLYRRRISGLGAFVPNKVTKRTKFVNESPLVTHHPQISFNSNSIDEIWHCPGIVIPSVQIDKPPETPLNIEELSTKINFDMKYKIPGDSRNNSNLSSISDSILGAMNPQEVAKSQVPNEPSNIPSTYDSVASSVKLNYGGNNGGNKLNDTPKTMNWNPPSYPQPFVQSNYPSGYPYGGPPPGYPAFAPPANHVLYPNQQKNLTMYPIQQQMQQVVSPEQQFQNPPNYAFPTTYPLQQYPSPTSFPMQDRFANKPNVNYANMGPDKNVRYPLGNEGWKHSRKGVNPNISQVTMSDMVQRSVPGMKSSQLFNESVDDMQRSSRAKDHQRRSMSKERSLRHSPEKKRRRSPERRKKSLTPDRRRRSRTPDRRRRSRTPDRLKRSRTPDRLKRSRTPDRRRKSHSPVERFKKDLPKMIIEKRKEETKIVDPKDKLLQKMWNPGDFNAGDKEAKPVQKVAGDKPKGRGNAAIGAPAGDLDMRNALLMFDGNKPTFITAESQLKRNEKPPISNQVIEIDSDDSFSDSEKSKGKILSKNMTIIKKEENREADLSGRIGLEDILTMGPQIRFMQEKSTLYRAIIQSLVKGDVVYKRLYAFKNRCLCRLLEGKVSEIVVPRESVKEFISLLHKNFHHVFFKELRRAIGEYCYPSLFQSASYNVSRVLSECPECIKDNNTPSSLRLIDENKQEKIKLANKERRIDKSPYREKKMFRAESPRRDRRIERRSRSSERSGRFGRIGDSERDRTYREDYQRGEEPPGYERAVKARPTSLEPFGPKLNNQSTMQNYLGNEMDDIDGVPIEDIEEIEVFGNVEEAESVAKDNADFIVLSELEDELETSKESKGCKIISKSPPNEKHKSVPLKGDAIGKVDSDELEMKANILPKKDMMSIALGKSNVKTNAATEKDSTPSISEKSDVNAVGTTKKDTTSVKLDVKADILPKKDATSITPGKSSANTNAATKKDTIPSISEKSDVNAVAATKDTTSGKLEMKAETMIKEDTTFITPGKSNAKTNAATKKDSTPSMLEKSEVNAVGATKKDTTSVKLDMKADILPKKDATSITPGKSNAKTNAATKKDSTPSILEKSEVNAVGATKKDNTSVKLDVKADILPKKDATSITPGKSSANTNAATKKDTTSVKLEMKAETIIKKETMSPVKAVVATVTDIKKETTSGKSVIMTDATAGKMDIKAIVENKKDSRPGMSGVEAVSVTKKDTTLPSSSGKCEDDKSPTPQEMPKDDKRALTKAKAPGGQAKQQTSPSDFKGKIRQVQESSSLFGDLLERLSVAAQSTILTDDNSCYSLKGGMLCKKCKFANSTEVRIVAPEDRVDEILSIVHTMSNLHTPYDKGLEFLRKHFTPIDNLQTRVSESINKCLQCK